MHRGAVLPVEEECAALREKHSRDEPCVWRERRARSFRHLAVRAAHHTAMLREAYRASGFHPAQI